MSQISVVQYSATGNQKLNVLQQNTSTNHVIVLRKPPPILPQPKDYTKDDILITNPGRKGVKKSGKDMKTSPPPIAVARRNARERNRVKQVNNGFANLRQHIPNFIAQAFESSNGRGNKKLSKVETLRMAVEYIRSLEEILALDGYVLPKQEDMPTCSSPSSQHSTNTSDLGYTFVMSPSDDEDDFSSVTTTSPQQYIRINTSNNTYEIVPTTLYDNSENMDPMSVDHQLLTDPNLLDSGLELNTQDLSYLQVNAESLSPELYSESSNEATGNQNCFIPVFSTGKLGENFNVHIKTEMNEIKEQNQLMHQENWWNDNANS